MARKKIEVQVKARQLQAGETGVARAWVSRAVANELDLKEKEDWIYLNKDVMGVLSTQARVEGIVDEEGFHVWPSQERMNLAHFKDGDTVKAWKLTEWE